MAITNKLSVELKDKLVAALLQCELSTGTEAGRQRLVDRLTPEIRDQIKYAASKKDALIEIVNVCSEKINGAYELYEAVRSIEGTSFAGQGFCLAFAEVEILSQCPDCANALSGLQKILETLILPEEDLSRLNQISTREIPRRREAPQRTIYTSFLEIAGWIPLEGLKFLERIVRHGGIGPPVALQKLIDWIEQSYGLLGLTQEHLDQLRHDAEQEAKSQIYALIKIVESEQVDDRYLLETWSWEKSRGMERLELPSHPSIDEPKKFSELEPIFREAVDEVVGRFGAGSDRIVIEIITQRKLFTKDVSTWKVYQGSFQKDLSLVYPMVLRWAERFTRASRHADWSKKWQTLKAEHKEPGLKGLKWLNCEDVCTADTILYEWKKQEGLCLALGYKPSEHTSEQDLLEAALNTGTPIAFWFHRTSEGEQISQQHFETVLGQARLMELPKYVWELRRKAYQDPDDPARRLTLLFDDPDRVLKRQIGQFR